MITNIPTNTTNSPSQHHPVPFSSADDVIRFFAHTVRTNGTPDLAGLEEEIGLLNHNGQALSHTDFQRVLATFISRLPNGQIHSGLSTRGDTIPIFSGTSTLGGIHPETNTTLIEFAHHPTETVWHTHYQSATATNILQRAARQHNCHSIGFGTVPTISWEDMLENDVSIPNAEFVYSWTHMTQGTRPEYCRTVFGTGSTHHNTGFDNPDEMARYISTTLRLQPTMIALLGNGALWNNAPATATCRHTDQQIPVLSHRSRMQIEYGQIFGAQDGVDYLYPDFLINPHATFNSIVNGYLDLPLDRTYAGNTKVACNGMTMRDYLARGLVHKGTRHFPNESALTMMIREPIVDVRPCFTGTAPRVETRAHDGVSHPVAVALDAFYRGIRTNLDTVQETLAPYTPEAIRQTRYDVCASGLATSFPHPTERTIHTQQDLARRLLAHARDGLIRRDEGEEVFLSPLWTLANSGRNPAHRLLDLFQRQARATNPLRTQQILAAMDYSRHSFADGEQFHWPRPRRVIPVFSPHRAA